MKRLILNCLVCSTLLFTVACKKKKKDEVEEETIPTPVTTYPSYSALKVGNYWIYRFFDIDANMNATPRVETDSCYISADTLIRNRKFFKLHRFEFLYNRPTVLYLADSLHYIINKSGQVLFSSEDFTTVFNEHYGTDDSTGDTTYKWTQKMDDKDQIITTPAGTFVTSDTKVTILTYPDYGPTPGYITRWMSNKYAKDVGLVLETEPLFLGTLFMRERRLIRYHLN